MTIPESCPKCESTQFVKSGKHYNLMKNVTQRYLCKVCGTTFCRGGYFRGKHELSLVQYAGMLYQNGLSMEKIVNQLKDKLNISVSKITIMYWIRMLGIKSRPKSCGDQKHKVIRELVEVGIMTTVRVATSENPEKIRVLDNIVLKA